MPLTRIVKTPAAMRRKSAILGGFTLIELLIVVAIIGIIEEDTCRADGTFVAMPVLPIVFGAPCKNWLNWLLRKACC